jgi:predicted dehydrogenase
MSETTNRRRFMTGAGSLAGASLLSAKSYGRVIGANERIQMGIIGAGGRGRSVMTSFNKFSDQCEFIHVCDVYEPNIVAALKLSRENAKTTMDYKEVLANKDVVAILNATPDHWHAGVLLDAVAAGKDAYTEKPFSYSIEQGIKMVKGVRATKQIVQVGMQRRSSEAVRGAKKIIDDGVLGEIVMARAQWFWNRKPMPQKLQLAGKLDWDRFQGPAKRHPLDERRFFHWRNFSDYNGGHMTDQGTHLMDVIQWFCNQGKPPQSAVCQGMITVHKGADVPDTFSAVFEYPGFLATWTLCYGNSYEESWKIFIQGKKATMVIDDDGYRIFAEPWSRPNAMPPAILHEYKGGIPTDPHVKNFLDCVKSRQEPNAPVEVGANAVTGPHLANLALRSQKRITLSADGTVAKL